MCSCFFAVTNNTANMVEPTVTCPSLMNYFSVPHSSCVLCTVYKAILWPVATKGVGILEMLETAPNDYRVLSHLTFAVPTHQRWRSESTVSPGNDCDVPFFSFAGAPRPRGAPDSRGSRDAAPGAVAAAGAVTSVTGAAMAAAASTSGEDLGGVTAATAASAMAAEAPGQGRFGSGTNSGGGD